MDSRIAAALSFALIAFACYVAVALPTSLGGYRVLLTLLIHVMA